MWRPDLKGVRQPARPIKIGTVVHDRFARSFQLRFALTFLSTLPRRRRATAALTKLALSATKDARPRPDGRNKFETEVLVAHLVRDEGSQVQILPLRPAQPEFPPRFAT